MESNETTQQKFDVKDMYCLLEDKTTIGSPLIAPIDKFNFNKYNIVNPPLKSKRILNTCTVRYLCQAYVFDLNSQKFEILDKNYKNIKKDKLSSMTQDKKWVRYCLLLMSEGEQTIFEIDKSILGDFFKTQVDKFSKEKRKTKRKN